MRLLLRPEPGAFPNLGSFCLGGMLRRLSEDWQAKYGHSLELAESFVDPAQDGGTVYRASNWRSVGRSAGYSRGRGGDTDPHGKRKAMYVQPLHRSSVARLCGAEPHPDWEVACQSVDATEDTLPSLLEELRRVPDFRQGQGRWRRLSTVLAICVLARLAGKVGGGATPRLQFSPDRSSSSSKTAVRKQSFRYGPCSPSKMAGMSSREFTSITISSIRVRPGIGSNRPGFRIEIAPPRPGNARHAHAKRGPPGHRVPTPEWKPN